MVMAVEMVARTTIVVALLLGQIVIGAGSEFGEASAQPKSSQPVQEEEDEPLYEKLKEHFKQDYLSIGAWLRTDLDIQGVDETDDNDGFRVSRFRFTMSGELDFGFGYVMQVDFFRSPSILDAKLYYHISDPLELDAGQFKSSFSREVLISGADRDFIDAAGAPSALAPNRQLGIQARGWISKDKVSYSAGVFNGNGTENNNDDGKFLYVARVAYSGRPLAFAPLGFGSEREGDVMEFGLNVAYSDDDDAPIGSLLDNFDGKRFIIGADSHRRWGKFSLTAEFIYAHLDFDSGGDANPFGFYATLGYKLSPKTRLAVRFDDLQTDGLDDDRILVIAAYSHRPTQATRFQINYGFDFDNIDEGNHVLTLSAQLRF